MSGVSDAEKERTRGSRDIGEDGWNRKLGGGALGAFDGSLMLLSASVTEWLL